MLSWFSSTPTDSSTPPAEPSTPSTELPTQTEPSTPPTEPSSPEEDEEEQRKGWLAWVRSWGLDEPTKAVALLLLSTYAELGSWSVSDLAVGLSYLRRANSSDWDAPSTDRAFLHRDLLDSALHHTHLSVAAYASSEAEWELLVEPLADSRLPVASGERVEGDGHGIELVKLEPVSTLLRPGYFIARDRAREAILLVIRGTDNNFDLLTDCCACGVPFEDGGYVHSGMHRAAKWFMDHELDTLLNLLIETPEAHIQLVGHSLGGGTAAILAALLRPYDPTAQAVAIGPPPVADVATSIAFDLDGLCTSFIHENDIVSRASLTAIDGVREEIQAFPWWDHAKADMLASPWISTPAAVVSSMASSLPSISAPAPLADVWSASMASLSAASAWLRPSKGLATGDPFHVEHSELEVAIELVPPGRIYHLFKAPQDPDDPGTHINLLDPDPDRPLQYFMKRVPPETFSKINMVNSAFEDHKTDSYINAILSMDAREDYV